MKKLSKPSNNQIKTLEGITSWCQCTATCRRNSCGCVDPVNRDQRIGGARDFASM